MKVKQHKKYHLNLSKVIPNFNINGPFYTKHPKITVTLQWTNSFPKQWTCRAKQWRSELIFLVIYLSKAILRLTKVRHEGNAHTTPSIHIKVILKTNSFRLTRLGRTSPPLNDRILEENSSNTPRLPFRSSYLVKWVDCVPFKYLP